MVHDDVDVALRNAAVMHQYHAAVAGYACDEPFGRRAVMQEVAGEADFPVPLPKRAAAGEVAPGRRCGLTVISGLDYDTMRLTPASRIRRIL